MARHELLRSIRPLLPFALALLGVSVSGSAEAQAPTPTVQTPGMIGGQTIGSGRMVLGASTGYPQTRFHLMWGLGDNFDLALQPGLTYGRSGWGGGPGWRRRRIDGMRQRVGLDMQVPLRWTLAEMRNASVALRLAPFFRVGEFGPAFSVGSLVGARFSIPLPKIFSLVVGPEARFAYASIDSNPNFDFFDGAVYLVSGVESLFRDKWIFNVQMDTGGYFGSHNVWRGGLFNIYFGFGALF